MAVAVRIGSGLTPSQPRLLFEERFNQAPAYGPKNYDVAPDGRFIMVKPKVDVSPTEIHVVLNWFEEVKRRVPTR